MIKLSECVGSITLQIVTRITVQNSKRRKVQKFLEICTQTRRGHGQAALCNRMVSFGRPTQAAGVILVHLYSILKRSKQLKVQVTDTRIARRAYRIT
jgi:hypothetical protein